MFLFTEGLCGISTRFPQLFQLKNVLHSTPSHYQDIEETFTSLPSSGALHRTKLPNLGFLLTTKLLSMLRTQRFIQNGLLSGEKEQSAHSMWTLLALGLPWLFLKEANIGW